MGVVKNVGHNTFPRQSNHVGEHAEVLFYYQRPSIFGVVLRDDAEAPWRTIIQLDDGRCVLGAECQWRPL